MKILFDIGHPAHVHLLKNLIIHLMNNDHKIIVTTRNKDITHTLLEYYGIDFICISNPGKNIVEMFLELCVRNIKIIRLQLLYNFDIFIGTSLSLSHISVLLKVPFYNLNEDDDDVVPFYAWSTYPFSTKIINPEIIRYRRWHSKRVKHFSYHELGYLHPNNFQADIEVLKKYNLRKRKYIVLRLSALNAHHDISAKGISKELWEKLKILLSNYRIIRSVENEKYNKIAPWEMHHVLAFSKMIISDSQTMTIEGAVLGVPSIRINSFVGRCSVIQELEDKYQLAYGYLPYQEDLALTMISDIKNNSDSEKIWGERRNKMLADKVDFNQWLIDFFENKLSDMLK